MAENDRLQGEEIAPEISVARRELIFDLFIDSDPFKIKYTAVRSNKTKLFITENT
jgi:hypothetical protein